MKILYIDPETEYAKLRAEWLQEAGFEVHVCSGLNGPNYADYDLMIISLGLRDDIKHNMRPALAEFDKPGSKVIIPIPVIFAGADDKDTLLALTHGATTCKLHELSQASAIVGIVEKTAGSGRIHS